MADAAEVDGEEEEEVVEFEEGCPECPNITSSNTVGINNWSSGS